MKIEKDGVSRVSSHRHRGQRISSCQRHDEAPCHDEAEVDVSDSKGKGARNATHGAEVLQLNTATASRAATPKIKAATLSGAVDAQMKLEV